MSTTRPAPLHEFVLKLPLQTEYIPVRSVADGHAVIKAMNVRGAPAIAIVAALSLAVELRGVALGAPAAFCDFVDERLAFLKTSRPTAVNLFEAAARLSALGRSELAAGKDAAAIRKSLVAEIEAMMARDVADNRAIGGFGAEHILRNRGGGRAAVLTHCNTGSLATAGYGTALGVIRALAERGLLEHAYCTESRPYNQGARLTAYELVHDKLPATLLCDSMVRARPPSALALHLSVRHSLLHVGGGGDLLARLPLQDARFPAAAGVRAHELQADRGRRRRRRSRRGQRRLRQQDRDLPISYRGEAPRRPVLCRG